MTKSVLLVKQICLQGITDKQTIYYVVVVDMINVLSLARYACLYLLAQRLLFLPCCLKQRKFLMSKILTRSFRVNSCFSCLTMWICWVRVITKVAKILWRVAIKRTINFEKQMGQQVLKNHSGKFVHQSMPPFVYIYFVVLFITSYNVLSCYLLFHCMWWWIPDEFWVMLWHSSLNFS